MNRSPDTLQVALDRARTCLSRAVLARSERDRTATAVNLRLCAEYLRDLQGLSASMADSLDETCAKLACQATVRT